MLGWILPSVKTSKQAQSQVRIHLTNMIVIGQPDQLHKLATANDVALLAILGAQVHQFLAHQTAPCIPTGLFAPYTLTGEENMHMCNQLRATLWYSQDIFPF